MDVANSVEILNYATLLRKENLVIKTENAKLHKVVEAARRVMDAVMAQPQDVVERNIALTWLDAALAELDKEES